MKGAALCSMPLGPKRGLWLIIPFQLIVMVSLHAPCHAPTHVHCCLPLSLAPGVSAGHALSA